MADQRIRYQPDYVCFKALADLTKTRHTRRRPPALIQYRQGQLSAEDGCEPERDDVESITLLLHFLLERRVFKCILRVCAFVIAQLLGVSSNKKSVFTREVDRESKLHK